MTNIALTIAGSDPSGGAGLQADLRTFAALGVYGCAVVTALTAQNTQGVRSSLLVAPRFVREQLDHLLADVRPAAAKTGMLASAAIVREVAQAAAAHRLANLVVDPVMRAKDGSALLDDEGVRVLKDRLLPLAALVTPNAPEASALSGLRTQTVEDAKRVAESLIELGCRAVLIKGGHLRRERGGVVDVFYDGAFREFRRLARRAEVHGTGCVLSAAIAASLAKGEPLVDAVAEGEAFLSSGLAAATKIGRGRRCIP